MSTIAVNTPGIPQVNTPQGVPFVKKTAVTVPESLQTPVVLDEIAEIPGAPTTRHQTEMPPGQVVSHLDSVVHHLTVSDQGIFSDRGDVDIAINENATFNITSMLATLNATGNVIEHNPSLVNTTLTAINYALIQTQKTSYRETFRHGTYLQNSVFSIGSTVSDLLSGSSMSLNASAQHTLEELASESLPTDPMAFVQFVLRESYLETTNILMDHANKVRFFNDVKKEIRAKAQEIRDVLAQNAGKEDTDVIGSTPTEDINMSYHGETAKNPSPSPSPTPPSITPETTGLTQAELDNANAEYLAAVEKNTTAKTFHPETYKKTKSYGGSDNYDKFTDHANDTSEDAVKLAVARMTPAQQKAILKHYESNGMHINLSVVETDGYNNKYSSKGANKTYPYPNESLEDFVKRAAKEQSADFASQVKWDEDEGDINITSLTTEIDWPSVGVTEAKQTPAELAAAHPNSTLAQAAANKASPTSNKGSEWKTGEPATTKAEHESALEKYEQQLNSVGDDAQLANVDLQNWLQKQQQTMQMMSNISKLLHDTAMAIIRKIG